MLFTQVALPTAALAGFLLTLWLALSIVRFRTEKEFLRRFRDALGEGVSAFALVQGSVSLLVGAAAAIMVGLFLGLAGGSLASGGLAGLALAVGALSSTFSVAAAMTLTARAAAQTTERAAAGPDPATIVALRAGAVPALLLAILPASLLAGLFGLYSRLLGESMEATALLVIPFALGTSISAFVATTGGGSFSAAGYLGSRLVAKVDRAVPAADLENTVFTAELAGRNAVDVGGRTAELFDLMAGAIVASMVIAAPISVVTGEEGWILFPLALFALAPPALILGLLVVPAWLVALPNPSRALVAAHWTGSLMSTVAAVLVAYILLEDGWLWFAACGVIGALLGPLLSEVVVRHVMPGGRGAPEIAQATAIGEGPEFLLRLASGLEGIAGPFLLSALALAGAFVLGREGGLEGGGSAMAGLAGMAITIVAMLMTAPYMAAISVAGVIADNSLAATAIPGAATGAEADTLRALERRGRIARALARSFTMTATVVLLPLLFLGFSGQVRRELAHVAHDEPVRYVRMTQDLGLLPPGADTEAEAVNALRAYLAAIAECDLNAEEEIRLAASASREAKARAGRASNPAGGFTACPAAEGGSPVPLPDLLPASPARAEAIAGALLGLGLAAAVGSWLLRSIWRSAGELVREARTHFRNSSGAPTGQSDPDYARAPRSGGAPGRRGAVIPALLFLGLAFATGLSLRFILPGPGNASWLFLAGLLATAALGLAPLGILFVEAGALLGRDEDAAPVTSAAPAETAGAPASVAELLAAPLGDALGPAFAGLARLIATAALVLVPLAGG